MVTCGILKYCLRGFLGPNQRRVTFQLLDACRKIFSEKQDKEDLVLLLEEINLVLACLERDMPVTIQV